jgi:hypothetical protein
VDLSGRPDRITRKPTPKRIPSPFIRLAKATVAEALFGGSDLVIAVDDLELANLGRANVVAAWARRAFEAEIQRQVTESYSSGSVQDRAFLRARSRCSFHLLVPMIEAYFFGDTSALARANALPPSAQLRHSDLEDFATSDAGYLASVEEAQQQKLRDDFPWFRYEKHPKHYLAYLADAAGGAYDETNEGVAALSSLDWAGVASFGAPLTFARALFQDIADLLDVPSPLGGGPCAPETYPKKAVDRSRLVIRNL